MFRKTISARNIIPGSPASSSNVIKLLSLNAFWNLNGRGSARARSWGPDGY